MAWTVFIREISLSLTLKVSQMAECSKLNQLSGYNLPVKNVKCVLSAFISVLATLSGKIVFPVLANDVMRLRDIDFVH